MKGLGTRLPVCRREYLRSLRDYLLGFLQRTQPLQDSAAQVAKADEQFEADWAAGAVPGWADAGKGGPPATAAAGALDVDAFDSVEELVQLGEGA
jgi:splicing factor 3A subunit 3